MELDLSDEQTVTLLRELERIIDESTAYEVAQRTGSFDPTAIGKVCLRRAPTLAVRN